LLYRIFCEENGFRLERLLCNRNRQWYSIEDPKQVGRRLEFQTKSPLLLYVSACKMVETPIFTSPPQQSDYQGLWSTPNQTKSADNSVFSKLVDMLRPLLPLWLWDVRRRFWQRNTRSLLIKRIKL
jgi:hypothetical protein